MTFSYNQAIFLRIFSATLSLDTTGRNSCKKACPAGEAPRPTAIPISTSHLGTRGSTFIPSPRPRLLRALFSVMPSPASTIACAERLSVVVNCVLGLKRRSRNKRALSLSCPGNISIYGSRQKVDTGTSSSDASACPAGTHATNSSLPQGYQSNSPSRRLIRHISICLSSSICAKGVLKPPSICTTTAGCLHRNSAMTSDIRP